MTIDELKAGMSSEAKREFGPVDEKLLQISLAACGMTRLPDVSGDPDGERCSGETICERCGRDYYSHPKDWRKIGYGNVPFLNILCDGRRVKL